MTSETGFGRFLLSFSSHWLTLMSGGLSVPLTIAAVFVQSAAYKVGLVTLAVVAFVGCSYSVWRNERRRAVEAEDRLAAGAEVQAQLARAQLAAHQRAEAEERAREAWLERTLAELRKPDAPELVRVAPGDQLHAERAIERGILNRLDTAFGTAVILPATERWNKPGSLEAKIREARRDILTTCAAKPGAWCGWDRGGLREQWGTYVAAAQQLEREHLISAKFSADNEAVAIRITVEGSEAVRGGTF